MKKKNNNLEKKIGFWQQRSVHYDKLFWTKDDGYLDKIMRVSNLKKDDLVLDVGVGTGAVARKIKPMVKHVIGLDIAESMLKQGDWEGISLLKWDICDTLFANNVFDKVFARMCFHHIIQNLDLAILRCYELLKSKGRLIVAEGFPPSDDPVVVHWYTEMFKLKEERLVFTQGELKDRLKRCGFKEIKVFPYIMKSFSVKNWLVNSGMPKKGQLRILKMHFEAIPQVKKAYNMRCTNDDCFIDTKNIIMVGIK